jgi:undecaprenyl-diphosphatase
MQLLVIGGLTILAAVLCACAHWEPRFPGDLRLTLLFQDIQSGTLDSIMAWVSDLTEGWPAAGLIAAGSIATWCCLGKLKAGLVLMTGLSSPIYSGLKLIVDRPRPTPDLVRVFELEHGNSFPSGHAFFAIVFWGLLAYFAFTRWQRRGLRILLLSSAVLVILWIGASRVYLGVHWPSDVLGGYVTGAVFLTTLIWLDRTWQRRLETRSPEGETDHPHSQPSCPPQNLAQ